MENLLSKKKFFGMALKLAMPIMIQNLISTLVSTADTLMLGYVSQTAMSASSLANQFVFVLFCFYYGLATATSVMCAQYWGKGDKKSIERIMGMATALSLGISVLFFAVSFFGPRFVMTIFSAEEEVIELGAQYLKVVSVSFVFMGISQVYTSAQRSIGKVVFPSALYVVSLCVNVFLNAAFIFGFFGLPKLGVVGVALGTVAARVVEVLLSIIHSVFTSEVKMRVKYIFSRAGILFKDFVVIAFPSIGNDIVWSLASSVFAIILGHLGNDVVAANSVAVMVVNIGAIATRGFANATTIIISQNLGNNKMEEAKVYAGRMIRLTLYVALVGCGVIMLVRPLMVNFYSDKLTPVALGYLKLMLIMNTWRLIGEGVNTCLICGCFRGGGDTKFGLYMDLFMMWGVAIPIMAAVAYIFKLSPMWVYLAMTLDEIEKMPVIFRHYFKFNWMKNITRDERELTA